MLGTIDSVIDRAQHSDVLLFNFLHIVAQSLRLWVNAGPHSQLAKLTTMSITLDKVEFGQYGIECTVNLIPSRQQKSR